METDNRLCSRLLGIMIVMHNQKSEIVITRDKATHMIFRFCNESKLVIVFDKISYFCVIKVP